MLATQKNNLGVQDMNDERPRLFVDMDGTLAEFDPTKTIEDLYQPGYFQNLKPNINVVRGIKNLLERKQSDVYILSAYLSDSKYALREKKEWIKRYIPELKPERLIFLPCGRDKAQHIRDKFYLNSLRRTDILLDDHSPNLLAWELAGGRGIKLINSINGRGEKWTGERISYEIVTFATDLTEMITDKTIDER